MEWIDTAVKKWCAQKRQEVLKTGSRALNCFYKRASVSAFRMTALIYHLWGEDNDKDATDNIQKRCIRFYRYMAQFILDGLLAKWGRQYEVLHKGDVQDDGNRVTLFDQLPDRFSRDQLRELIVKLDLSSPDRIFIAKWKKMKLVNQPDEKQEIYYKTNPQQKNQPSCNPPTSTDSGGCQ